MPISDTAIKAAKPRTDKPYKLPDEKFIFTPTVLNIFALIIGF